MPCRSLIDLDGVSHDEINMWLSFADELEKGWWDVRRSLEGKILCPIFLQESSRTYINAVSSFLQMGGRILPLSYAGTRFGSKWHEPVQDFTCLINACCDQVICRSDDMQMVRDFAAHVRVPFINAGNGKGVGSEHPMQALVDIYTLRQYFGSARLRILMMGGAHIRSTRSQIKLFLRYRHDVTVMSPPSKVDNFDIEEIIESRCQVLSSGHEGDWSGFDVIYHNGIDEDPDAVAPRAYHLNRRILHQRRFSGKVMHSLPRKGELASCVDSSNFNAYFRQMENSKWVFQSIFWHQHHGGEERRNPVKRRDRKDTEKWNLVIH